MQAEYNISKTVGHDDWRGMRLILDGEDGETPKELMDRVRQEVDDWFFNTFGPGSNPPFPMRVSYSTAVPEIKVEKDPVEERLKRIISDINTCTELKVLESYRLLATTDLHLKMAYDLKLKELTDANK